MSRHTTAVRLALVLTVAVAPWAQGGTLYVANNGINSTLCGFFVIGGSNCGAKEFPCRSISCAIREAAAGDVILVGPGAYGDLDGDGTIAERGEELGGAGCDCMLLVNKSVTIVSTDGAAATVIDARTSAVDKNVLIMATDVVFGAPGKGFMVTTTGALFPNGIEINGAEVTVRGNQILGDLVDPDGEGIRAREPTSGPVLIEGNQIIGWAKAIEAATPNTTVRKNQVSLNAATAIDAETNTLVVGNVATRNGSGIGLTDSASAVGNAVYGSTSSGIFGSSSGIAEKNNIVGNECGMLGSAGFPATNNFWGAATGPGPDPADDVCSGTPTVTPFATKPFKVKARIKP